MQALSRTRFVQLTAMGVLLALLVAPFVYAGAAGTITFSSPVAGSSYSGTQTLVINGTISPNPTPPDELNIIVTQQGSSTPLIAQNVQVGPFTGIFTLTTNVGGNAAWTPGTYVITVSDSYGNGATTTFTYTGTGTTTTTTSSTTTSSTSSSSTTSSTSSTTTSTSSSTTSSTSTTSSSTTSSTSTSTTSSTTTSSTPPSSSTTYTTTSTPTTSTTTSSAPSSTTTSSTQSVPTSSTTSTTTSTATSSSSASTSIAYGPTAWYASAAFLAVLASLLIGARKKSGDRVSIGRVR